MFCSKSARLSSESEMPLQDDSEYDRIGQDDESSDLQFWGERGGVEDGFIVM